jgi:hypothetical protein
MITIDTDPACWGSAATERWARDRCAAVIRAFKRAGWTVELDDYLRGTDHEHYLAHRTEDDTEINEDENLAWFNAWVRGGAWAVYKWACS